MTFSQSREHVLKAMAKWRRMVLDDCSFTITSTPIHANPRKLRVVWVLDEDQHIEVGVEPGVEERLIDMLAYRDNVPGARVMP